MKLYVIRHGETEMGKNEIIATEDEPLNERGKKQAEKVGTEINNLDIDYIFCSPIDRAKHTLELFNINNNIPIFIEDRLKERNMGVYEKTPFKMLDWNTFWGYNSETKYKDLESMKDVYKRISSFLNELKNEYSNKNILLVTHGGVIRAINWYVNGISDSKFIWDNCKVYEFKIQNSTKI